MSAQKPSTFFLSLTTVTNNSAKMSIIYQNFFTNNLQWLPTTHIPNSLNHTRPITRIFTYSTSSSSLDKKFNTRLSLSTNGGYVKSSFDYNNNHNGVNANNGHYEYEKGLLGNSSSHQYPKPTEVPWTKELCNSVQLIGNVGTPVEFKQLSSGKSLAWCRLAVKKSSTDTTWINLTFWDDLAHIASQHVEKGQQIYVLGRIVSDTVDSDDGKQQTYYKVVVQQLNFVEKSPPSNDRDFNYNSNSNSNSNSSSMTTGKKQKIYAANGGGSTEELWQAFFANPVEWWDNRKNKRSSKHPDFKHKDTGEALWVEGRYNPSWVKSQLSILDSKMESFHQQNSKSRSDSMFGDNLTPY